MAKRQERNQAHSAEQHAKDTVGCLGHLGVLLTPNVLLRRGPAALTVDVALRWRPVGSSKLLAGYPRKRASTFARPRLPMSSHRPMSSCTADETRPPKSSADISGGLA